MESIFQRYRGMKKINCKRGLDLLKEPIASLKLGRAFLFVDQP